MKKILLYSIVIAALFGACQNDSSEATAENDILASAATDSIAQLLVGEVMVLNLEDFGPYELSKDMVGKNQLAWDEGDSPKIKDFTIKYVVYRKAKLDDVAKKYRSDRKTNMEFRYRKHASVLRYFDKYMNSPEVSEEVRKTLQIGKSKVGAVIK